MLDSHVFPSHRDSVGGMLACCPPSGWDRLRLHGPSWETGSQVRIFLVQGMMGLITTLERNSALQSPAHKLLETVTSPNLNLTLIIISYPHGFPRTKIAQALGGCRRHQRRVSSKPITRSSPSLDPPADGDKAKATVTIRTNLSPPPQAS